MDPVCVMALFLVIINIMYPYGIHVAEAGITNPNLALLKPATQSSTNDGKGAENAVEGDMEPYMNYGTCAQTTNVEAWMWWMVDLQESHTIESVRLTNRLDSCCRDDLSKFHVEVSTDHPSTLPGFPGRTSAAVCINLTTSVPNQFPVTYACDQPVTGRYVRVAKENTDGTPLSLCEFEAYTYVETNVTYFPPSPYNLAVNKTATQVSTEWPCDASKAVDGDLDGYIFSSPCHCTHTARTEPDDFHWWMVDLETNFTIYGLNIVSRTDCCQLRLRDFTIEVSMEEPSTLAGFPGYTDASVCTRQIDILPYIRPVTLACDQPVNGHYVRIVMSGNRLTLCEVEVLDRLPYQDVTEVHVPPRVIWRFVYVTGNGGGDHPHSMAAQRLMTSCARRRYRGSKDPAETPYIHVDLNSGACRFYQNITGSMIDTDNDWVVYKLE